MEKYTHFIAFDFGTYGCGIATSTNTIADPDKVRVFSNWPMMSNVEVKCPAILLLDDEGRFEAFGNTALKSYQTKNGLRRPEKLDQYYLFNRFKMCLYDKNLTRDLKIKAANGRELPAITVITITLNNMKKLICKEMQDQVKHPNQKIQWILTVPAIWSPAAKQIMKEAAIKAGLAADKDSLRLVLEPEAAAAYCLNEICSLGPSNLSQDEVNHYLLADCGGGTIDIVAHKLTRKANGEISIEEIHQAHGGPYGGFAVNDEFEKMVQKMLQLSSDELNSIKIKHPRHWTRLVYDQFEVAKHSVDPDKTHERFTIKFPKPLCKTIESLKSKTISDLIENYKRHEVEWDEDENELVLTYGTMDSLFLQVAPKIITVISEVLQKPECELVNKIVLVGGFAESGLLFSKIEKFYSTKYVVKRSTTPWLSVLKGAVMFAMHDVIQSRKMSQTLGIEIWGDFKPGFHKEDKKITVDGRCLCQNIFSKFVEVNESVKVAQTFEHVYPPASSDDDHCKVKIYGASHSRPVYTDENGCYLVAVIDVALPVHKAEESRKVRVIMQVGGTEITVSAVTSSTSQPLSVHLDLVVDKYAEKKKK